MHVFVYENSEPNDLQVSNSWFFLSSWVRMKKVPCQLFVGVFLYRCSLGEDSGSGSVASTCRYNSSNETFMYICLYNHQ